MIILLLQHFVESILVLQILFQLLYDICDFLINVNCLFQVSALFRGLCIIFLYIVLNEFIQMSFNEYMPVTSYCLLALSK